jgi:hypothetical protein
MLLPLIYRSYESYLQKDLGRYAILDVRGAIIYFNARSIFNNYYFGVISRIMQWLNNITVFLTYWNKLIITFFAFLDVFVREPVFFAAANKLTRWIVNHIYGYVFELYLQ